MRNTTTWLLALGLCSMLACGQSDSTGTIAAPVDGGQLGDASPSDITAPMEDAEPDTSEVTPDAPEDTTLDNLTPADIHDDELQDDAPSDIMTAETGELDSGQDALPGDVSAEDGGEMDTAADASPGDTTTDLIIADIGSEDAPSDVSTEDLGSEDAPSDVSTEDLGSEDAPSDVSVEDVAATEDAVTPEDAGADINPLDETLHEQLLHFEAVGVGADAAPVLMSQVIQLPESFESVEAQIAVRGDLDAFPMAFMALLVEQDGSLSQCGDLAGLPQKPNNLLDDVYRVAFPRPQNLDGASVYAPASPPYDYQPIPCQEAFEGKTEIEIGIIAVGLFAPGVGTNQGPDACGGAGCPNDALIHLRFVPQPDPEASQSCAEDAVAECVCPDGTYGTLTCEGGLWSEGCGCEEEGPEPTDCVEGEQSSCLCPDDTPSLMTCEGGQWTPCSCENAGPATPAGTCDEPYPFDLGPGAAEEVTIALLGTSLQEVPWPPFMSACPTSKPPFSTEYHYAMTVTEPGDISVTFEAIPEPWEITQYWLDMLGGCGVPLQCNNSWSPLEGYAEAGTYIIGLTVAPPNEIFIPDQDGWEFAITATWSPGEPPP